MHQPKKTGLIVDDEKLVQYVLLKQLEPLGYECEFASSGQEALEKVADKEFDLMLLDMRMPGMSGLKVLQMFRPEHPRTCIVVLSAVADAFIAADAMRLGADDYLVKPCHPADLATRLQRAFARRELVNKGGTPVSQVDVEIIERDLEIQQEISSRHQLGVQRTAANDSSETLKHARWQCQVDPIIRTAVRLK